MKRGYLLPKGCKDLIDVLKLKHQQQLVSSPLSRLPTQFVHNKPAQKPTPLPAVKGELIIQDPTTVARLAAQLGQKPFKIIADLMMIGVFATTSQQLSFEHISVIARQYGFIAKRAG